ncbi:MAG TPA: DUF4131 domain-containing protein, partial [Clostridiaceae bacterium]|nr:DUF4131 domain-containing protein [Clostridiaceae bacterium]
MQDKLIRSARAESWREWLDRRLLRPMWLPLGGGLLAVSVAWYCHSAAVAAWPWICCAGAIGLVIAVQKHCDHLFFFTLSWLCIGIISSVTLNRVQPLLSQQATAVSGEVINFLDRTQYGAVTNRKENKSTYRSIVVKSTGGVRILLRLKEGIPCEIGDIINWESPLLKPEGARNPGGFSANRWLAGKRIFVQTDLLQPEQITVQPVKYSFNGRRVVRFVRFTLSNRFITWLGPQNGGLLAGMLLGERDAILKDDNELFKTSGIAHLLVVSGGHTHIVMDMVLFIFVAIQGKRRSKWILKLFVLAAFGMLTGWGTAATRAILMHSLDLAAVALRRRGDALNSLLVSCWLMLAINPFIILQMGFWLSTVITGALVICYPGVTKYLKRSPWYRYRFARHGISSFIAAAIASFVGLPLTVMWQDQISFLQIPLNVIALPCTTIILGLGIGLLFIGSIPWLRPLCAVPLNTACQILRKLAGVAASKQLAIQRPKRWIIFSVILLLIIVWSMTTSARLCRRGLAFIIAICVLFSGIWGINTSEKLSLWFFDVGQGNALLIKFGIHHILIDCGTDQACADR